MRPTEAVEFLGLFPTIPRRNGLDTLPAWERFIVRNFREVWGPLIFDVAATDAFRLTPIAEMYLDLAREDATLSSLALADRVARYRAELLVVAGYGVPAEDYIVEALLPLPPHVVMPVLRHSVWTFLLLPDNGLTGGVSPPTNRWPVRVVGGRVADRDLDLASAVRHEVAHVLFDYTPGGPPMLTDTAAEAVIRAYRTPPAPDSIGARKVDESERRAMLVSAAWGVGRG